MLLVKFLCFYYSLFGVSFLFCFIFTVLLSFTEQQSFWICEMSVCFYIYTMMLDKWKVLYDHFPFYVSKSRTVSTCYQILEWRTHAQKTQDTADLYHTQSIQKYVHILVKISVNKERELR